MKYVIATTALLLAVFAGISAQAQQATPFADELKARRTAIQQEVNLQKPSLSATAAQDLRTYAKLYAADGGVNFWRFFISRTNELGKTHLQKPTPGTVEVKDGERTVRINFAPMTVIVPGKETLWNFKMSNEARTIFWQAYADQIAEALTGVTFSLAYDDLGRPVALKVDWP
ncbi:MAG: hypothetical protein GC129_03565 [Proteobacteria bacterium]|nr:hypothetical protein [Pseudomonadota bacterium]